MIRKAIIVVLTLAAVGTAWLVLVSYSQQTDYTWIPTEYDQLGFHIGRGQIGLFHSLGVRRLKVCKLEREVFELADESLRKSLRRLMRFRFAWFHRVSPTRYRSNVIMPLWAPFILFAAYPTIAFIRGPLRRYRRRRKGLCLKCGYFLTGNVSGTCPECGTPATKPDNLLK